MVSVSSSIIGSVINFIYIYKGEIQLWIDGTSVINVSGLMLREEEASHIKGMHFQTFFGGIYLTAGLSYHNILTRFF